MFDQLYKSSQAITRHEAAPYAQERSRYLEYCRQRGDALSTVITKASDLLWIVRQLSAFADLRVTIEQVCAVVVASGDDAGACRRNLDSPATRKRLIDTARSWLRFLGYLREPAEQIPFQSRLDEYCQWAKHERGLSDATIYSLRQRIKQFVQWYGTRGRPLSDVRISDCDAYLAFGGEERPTMVSCQRWERG